MKETEQGDLFDAWLALSDSQGNEMEWRDEIRGGASRHHAGAASVQTGSESETNTGSTAETRGAPLLLPRGLE